MLLRTLRTETGSVVPGTKARLIVWPVALSVNRKAKASVYEHWNVPYSSEANTKLKEIVLANGTKSN